MQKAKTDSHFPLAALAFLFLGPIFSWSLQPLFMRWFAAYYDPWTQNAFRFSAAAICVLILGKTRGILTFRLPRAAWLAIAMVSIANIAQQTFFAWTYEFIYPSVAILVARTDIIFICIISFIVFPDERSIIRSPRFLIGAALALGGVMVVLFGRDPEILDKLEVASTTFWIGVFISTLYALSCASYSVTIKSAMRRIDPLICFIHVCWISSVVFTICALIFGNISDLWLSRPETSSTLWTDPITWMLITGITSIAIAHPFLYAALRGLKAVVAVTLLMLLPFITCTLSAVVYDDRLTIVQGLGGLTVIVGAWLASIAQARIARKHREEAAALADHAG